MWPTGRCLPLLIYSFATAGHPTNLKPLKQKLPTAKSTSIRQVIKLEIASSYLITFADNYYQCIKANKVVLTVNLFRH